MYLRAYAHIHVQMYVYIYVHIHVYGYILDVTQCLARFVVICLGASGDVSRGDVPHPSRMMSACILTQTYIHIYVYITGVPGPGAFGGVRKRNPGTGGDLF